MAKTLTRLKRRVHEFTDECSTGTFTRECSRKDLRTIAEALGAHKTWTEENFVDRKIAICKRFDLGSKKFSQALDKIKESRELGVIVGLEQELHHLSDKKAFDVLRLWAKVNFLEKEDHEDLGLDFFNRDFDKVREHLRIRRELDDAVQAILTSNELADLEALFYIGRGPEYGESYDRVLQSTKASHGSTPAPDVHQILSKTSLLENVALGAQLVGRPSLAAKLRALRPNVDLDDAALS